MKMIWMNYSTCEVFLLSISARESVYIQVYIHTCSTLDLINLTYGSYKIFLFCKKTINITELKDNCKIKLLPHKCEYTKFKKTWPS